jgi:hypothetical protein
MNREVGGFSIHAFILSVWGWILAVSSWTKTTGKKGQVKRDKGYGVIDEQRAARTSWLVPSP